MNTPTAPAPASVLAADITEVLFIFVVALEVAFLLEFISKPITCPLYVSAPNALAVDTEARFAVTGLFTFKTLF